MANQTQRNHNCYLLCGGTYVPAFIKNGYTIIKCTSCGLYSLETYDDYDKFIKEFYTAGYFDASEEDKVGYADYSKEEPLIRKNARAYLKRINKLKPSGKLLDVGCAEGFSTDEARRMGYDVWGIDVSSYAVNQAKKLLGDRVTAVPLHEARFEDNTFDVVIMFDIIEHLVDPRTDLQGINQALKPNGLLVLCTGDVESLYARIVKTHYHFFAPPFHLHFFSVKTITMLLKQSGFKIIKIEKRGKWFSFPYAIRVLQNMNLPLWQRIFQSSTIKQIVDRWSFYFFAGDNMVVYAKKHKGISII